MKKYIYPLFMVFTLVLLVGLSAMVFRLHQQMNLANMRPDSAVTTTPSATLAAGVVSYHNTVTKTAPAVVNIFTTQKVQAHPMMNDPFFERFFGGGQSQQPDATSLGSGVIVSAKGYILTNNHVVEQADTIVVALQDGRTAQAKIIGTDPESDMAVIQITLPSLPTIAFRSTPVNIGDVVLAIGNPFGVGQTVTHGIISATNRSGLGINTFESFIQTDAPINPGNSGGALVDVAGNLVGINTAIFSKSGGSMGIGFAIPAPVAQSVMNAIIANGHVQRGWLGVEIKDLNPNASNPNSAAIQALNATNPQYKSTQGVMIMGVATNGPAAKAGLKLEDIVVSINGKAITSANQLVQIIANISPTNQAVLGLLRAGKPLTVKVVVGERPLSDTARNTSNSAPKNPTDNPHSQGQLSLPPQLQEFLFGR